MRKVRCHVWVDPKFKILLKEQAARKNKSILALTEEYAKLNDPLEDVIIQQKKLRKIKNGFKFQI